MKISSNIYENSLFLNLPTLRWITQNIIYPAFCLFYILLMTISLFVVGFHFVLIIFLIPILIPYFHIRNGRIGVQTLKLDKYTLKVTNRLFPFSFTRKYPLSSLEVKSVTPWNKLTGKNIRLVTTYAKIIINNSIHLHYLYELEKLEQLKKTWENVVNKF